MLSLAGLLVLAGCGEPDEAHGKLAAALSATFSATSPLCPATSSWGAWAQTSLSTWDSDVQPVVQWIINRTGISSSTYSGHSPSIGRAADWRPHSREEGTELANWFLANTKSGGAPLGIDYIIWQAAIYLPSSGGVKPMEDRGSFTQNHCDHIHISFVKKGSVSFVPASTTPWGDPPPPDAGPAKDTSLPSLPPDAGPPPAQSLDSGPPPSSLDAGGPAPPASPEPTPAPAAPEEEPTTAGGELVGGCALRPADREAAESAWLLLLGLAALARRRRSW